MTVKIQLRRGTAAQWTSANPVLLAGEQGLETDTGRTKIGNGVTQWNSLGYAFIQNSIVDSKGDLIAGTAADTVARLAVGTNEQRLVADSTQTTGLRWVADTTNYVVAAKGDLIAGTAADTVASLAVGTNNTLLVADSTAATGLKWATLTAAQIPSITSTKVSTVDINSQSSSYTLVLADASKLLLMTSASAQTVTIPTNASVAFPTGTKIDIVQTGAGQCDIAGASGVTLNSEGSKKKINAQYQVVSIVKTATDTWLLMGALKA